MFLSRLPRAACSWIQCFCWSNYNPWARPIQRHYPKVLANLYIARDDLQFAMVEKRSLTQKGCVCLLVLCWTFTSCNHLPWDNQLTRNFLMYIYICIYMYLYLYNYMYSYNYRRVWYIYIYAETYFRMFRKKRFGDFKLGCRPTLTGSSQDEKPEVRWDRNLGSNSMTAWSRTRWTRNDCLTACSGSEIRKWRTQTYHVLECFRVIAFCSYRLEFAHFSFSKWRLPSKDNLNQKQILTQICIQPSMPSMLSVQNAFRTSSSLSQASPVPPFGRDSGASLENLQFWFPKNNLSQVSHIFFSSFFVSSYLLIKPWGTLSSVLSKWIFAALEERLPSKYPVLWAISRGQSSRRSWHHRNLGHVADVTHRKASSGVLSPPLRCCCSHLFRWSVCGEVFAHCTHCWSVEHRM